MKFNALVAMGGNRNRFAGMGGSGNRKSFSHISTLVTILTTRTGRDTTLYITVS